MNTLEHIMESILAGVLSEDKISDLKQSNPRYANQIQKIADADPSEKKQKYLQYAVKQLVSHQALENEIIDVIQLFHRYNSKLPQKDINQWNFTELRDKLFSMSKSGDALSKKEKAALASEGAEKLYEDDSVTVYHIDSKNASVKYGKGTKWCITMAYDDYFFDYRSANVVFYFILSKTLTAEDPMHKVALSYQRQHDGKTLPVDIFDATDKVIQWPDVEEAFGKDRLQKIKGIVEKDSEARPTNIELRFKNAEKISDFTPNELRKVIVNVCRDRQELLPQIKNDVKALQKIVEDSGDSEAIITFAKEVQDADIPSLQKALEKKNDAHEASSFQAITTFAKEVRGADIPSFQKAVEKKNDAHEMYMFANIPGADKKALHQAIIKSGDGDVLVWLAADSDDPKFIKAIEDAVIAGGVAWVMLNFALDVGEKHPDDVDFEKLKNAIFKTDDEEVKQEWNERIGAKKTEGKIHEKARSTYGAANPNIRTGASGGTTGVGQKRGPIGGYPNPSIPETPVDDDNFKSALGIHADNEAVEKAPDAFQQLIDAAEAEGYIKGFRSTISRGEKTSPARFLCVSRVLEIDADVKGSQRIYLAAHEIGHAIDIDSPEKIEWARGLKDQRSTDPVVGKEWMAMEKKAWDEGEKFLKRLGMPIDKEFYARRDKSMIRNNLFLRGKKSLGEDFCLEMAEPEHKGFFVGLKIPPELGKLIAVPDGEPLDKLHVTLVYTEEGTQAQRQKAVQIVRDMLRAHGPVPATLGGLGRFSASESSDGKDVLYVSVDSVPLTELRTELVFQLKQLGIKADATHGYTPHVTIKYIEPAAPLPVKRLQPTPVVFAEPVFGGLGVQTSALVKRSNPTDLVKSKTTDILDKIRIGIMADLVTKVMSPDDISEAPLQEVNPALVAALALSAPQINQLVTKAAQKYDVPKELVLAVIDAESSGNPRAKSKVGAQGMMQLMPATFKELGGTDPEDPEQNIDTGTHYLRKLADRFDGDTKDTLAAYNAGPTVVNRRNTLPPETLRYVQKVLNKSKVAKIPVHRRGARQREELDLVGSIVESLAEAPGAESSPTTSAAGNSPDPTKDPKTGRETKDPIPSSSPGEYEGRAIDESLARKIIEQFRELMLSKRKVQLPPNPKALGAGTHGTAFDIGGGKVLKITSDEDEARSSKKVQGVETRFICKIYDVFGFRLSGAYGIVMEKLQDISENEQAEIGEALESLKVYAFLQSNDFEWDVASRQIAKGIHTTLEKMKSQGKDTARLYEQFSKKWASVKKFKIPEMAQELKANGIKFFDYHSRNIMRKPGGDYVIVDLGHESQVQGGGKQPDILETVVQSVLEAPETSQVTRPERSGRPTTVSKRTQPAPSSTPKTASKGSSQGSSQGKPSPFEKSGGEAYFQEVIQLNAVGLKNNGIDAQQLKPLGHGQDGVAYDCGGGRVLKITVDPDEANTDNGLKGKSLKHVVKIFDVWKLKTPEGKTPLFGIHEERLTPLSTQEKKDFAAATEFFDPEMTPKAKDFRKALRMGDWNALTVVLKKIMADEVRSEMEVFDQYKFDYLSERRLELVLQQLEKFNLKEMMTELRENHVEFTDYHGGNVMKRGGDYVINDLGRSGAQMSGQIPVLERMMLELIETLTEDTGGAAWGGPGSAGAGAGMKAQSSAWSSPSGMASRKDPNDPEQDDDFDEGLWQLTLMRKDNGMQKMTFGQEQTIEPEEQRDEDDIAP